MEIEKVKSSPTISTESLKIGNEKLNKEIIDLNKIVEKFTECNRNFAYMLGHKEALSVKNI